MYSKSNLRYTRYTRYSNMHVALALLPRIAAVHPRPCCLARTLKGKHVEEQLAVPKPLQSRATVAAAAVCEEEEEAGGEEEE
jgi:hypothetical protein